MKTTSFMVPTESDGLNLQASLPNSFFAYQTPQILKNPFPTSKLIRCISKETPKAQTCGFSLRACHGKLRDWKTRSTKFRSSQDHQQQSLNGSISQLLLRFKSYQHLADLPSEDGRNSKSRLARRKRSPYLLGFNVLNLRCHFVLHLHK
jgi:hypothetical protein